MKVSEYAARCSRSSKIWLSYGAVLNPTVDCLSLSSRSDLCGHERSYWSHRPLYLPKEQQGQHALSQEATRVRRHDNCASSAVLSYLRRTLAKTCQ